MRIESKQSLFLHIPILLMVPFTGLLLFICGVIIKTNIHELFNLEIITTILFVAWLAIFPLIVMIQALPSLVFENSRLELSYFYGFITRRYELKNLRQSNFSPRGDGILIELENGDQVTIGRKQFLNYDELKKFIEDNIAVTTPKIKLKRTTKIMRIMIWFGAIILLISVFLYL